VVVHIFLAVDGEWVVLVIVDDHSRSCDNCAWAICALTCFVVLVAYACLEVCLSSFDLQGSWHLLLNLTLGLICLGFRLSIVFCIEKSCAFLATLLSLELDVCHPHGLV
jgi:uncharacterized membrane protein